MNKHLPADEFSPEVIDELITRLAKKGVKVIELPDVDDKVDVPFVENDDDDAPVVEGDMVIEMEPEKEEESYGRSDDPVRMYLREMGNVELLSREGEIEIAKRIESGREMVISSLCESPTVMHMVLEWRDKLAGSEMLLREMIDLDATYGAGRKHASGNNILLNNIRKFPRQALHAAKIALIHPRTQKRLECEAPLPQDLESLLLSLRELK